MNDVQRELAHAQDMAGRTHRADCVRPLKHLDAPGQKHFEHPDPECSGCMPAKERRLWRQLAAEYQAHLDRNREDTLL